MSKVNNMSEEIKISINPPPIENILIGNKSEITKDELYEKIRQYEGNWSRHQECLRLVEVS